MKKCAVCHQEFTPKAVNQIYCSGICARKAENERRRSFKNAKGRYTTIGLKTKVETPINTLDQKAKEARKMGTTYGKMVSEKYKPHILTD